MAEAQRSGFEIVMTVVMAAVFLGVLCYAALRERPMTDPGQLMIMRVVMMIVAGLFGYLLTGTIVVSIATWVRATGGFALAVLVWLTNPPALIAKVHADPADRSAPPAPRVNAGKGSTYLGPLDRDVNIGENSTVVGPTDDRGNTILNRGGIAIGAGAKADPTSIAIGAGALGGAVDGGVTSDAKKK